MTPEVVELVADREKLAPLDDRPSQQGGRIENRHLWSLENPVATGVLVSIVALGIAVRLPGLTNSGLWRDDSWTALTSRVDLGTALRMSSTTPGFTLAERTWIGFDHGSSSWAQLLPFVAGVCGIVAIYLLVRYWGLARWLALSAAFVVAASPIAAQYSTHVKEYSTDFLLACLILWRGEAARRSPTNNSLILLTVASAAAVVISGAVVPVVIGSWAAVVLCHFRDRGALRRIAVSGAVTLGFFGVIYILFFRSLPGVLHRFWANGGAFLDHSSVHALWDSFGYALSVITVGIFPTAGHTDVYGGAHWTAGRIFVPAALLMIVLLLGLTTGRRSVAPGITLLVAVGASFIGAIPLGTGRTDEVLYPAIILLAALGIHQIVQQNATRIAQLRHGRGIGFALLALAVGLFAVASVNSYSVRHPNRYPVVNVRQLATIVKEHIRPGDRVLVDPYTRYDWTLYEANQVRVVFGDSWGAGFTVVSDQPQVFVAPSEPWEDGYRPEQWVAKVEPAKRIWYVGTDVVGRNQDPVYRALVAQGWTTQKEYRAAGGFVLLMTGGGAPGIDRGQTNKPA